MFFRYNLYAFLWALCMFGLNLGRNQGLENIQILYFLHFDDLAHFFQFCLLTFLLIVGFSKQQRYVALRFNSIRMALMVSIAYAFVLEAIHFWRHSAYFEIWDISANILGCLGGALIFFLIYKFSVKN